MDLHCFGLGQRKRHDLGWVCRGKCSVFRNALYPGSAIHQIPHPCDKRSLWIWGWLFDPVYRNADHTRLIGRQSAICQALASDRLATAHCRSGNAECVPDPCIQHCTAQPLFIWPCAHRQFRSNAPRYRVHYVASGFACFGSVGGAASVAERGCRPCVSIRCSEQFCHRGARFDQSSPTL